MDANRWQRHAYLSSLPRPSPKVWERNCQQGIVPWLLAFPSCGQQAFRNPAGRRENDLLCGTNESVKAAMSEDCLAVEAWWKLPHFKIRFRLSPLNSF